MAVKYLGLPIDFKNGQEYSEYTGNLLKNNKYIADLNGVGLDRLLGAALSSFTVLSIREEISYRFLLETIVLHVFFPNLQLFQSPVPVFLACYLLHDTCTTTALVKH